MLGRLLDKAEYPNYESQINTQEQIALTKLVSETFHSPSYKQAVLKQQQGMTQHKLQKVKLSLNPDKRVLGDNFGGNHYVN